MVERTQLMDEAVEVIDTTRSARRSPLANVNLRLLWLGESVSLFGDQFYLVALPWLVLELTGSAIAVGAVFAVAGVPRALFMLIGGVLTDRLSPRRLMITSNALRIGITGVLTLVVLTQTVQVWMLYVISLAFGIVDAFFHPAFMAMIPAIVPSDDLEVANTALQGTSLVISAVGPGIGGAVVKLVGIGFSFVLDTLSFAVATLTLLFMDPIETAKPADKATSLLADIREGLTYIARDTLLRQFVLISMAVNFLFAGPFSVGPSVMAKTRFIEGPVALGVLFSAVGLGSLIGMLVAGVLKPARLGVAALLTVGAAGVCIALVGFTNTLWFTALLFAAAGASSGFSNILLLTWLQRRVSKDVLGRVMSIAMLASVGLMPVAAAVGGYLAEYNLTLLFALNGALLVVTVAVSLLSREVRAMRV